MKNFGERQNVNQKHACGKKITKTGEVDELEGVKKTLIL